MNYSIELYTSIPSIFYKDDILIFKVLKSTYFFRSKCRIVSPEDEELLVFTSFNFFLYKKIRVVRQNLKNFIKLEQQKSKVTLTINNNKIFIKEKLKIVGKYEATCWLNDKFVGEIKENSSDFVQRYTVTFSNENENNFYFLILFSMLSVVYANPA